ncbi:MAG: Trigger factor [Alphaproteobacteria bacterium MarineAlpha4_Bin2]|nr:MAG: Trigger factor [Alphaproteobacteria bacterium MarineAlpha4_Bin2]
MQVTETKNEGLSREYTIVIPASDIEDRVLSKLSEIGKSVSIPGFRQGKVPTKLLRQRYGQAVLAEVVQDAVVETSSQAINDNDLNPATQPKIDVTKFEDGEALEYTMAVEIMPEITPIDFKTLKLERLTCDISDEEIEKSMSNIASEVVRSEPIKRSRKARKDDIVVIDFVGTVDGKEFDGGKAEDFQLTLGSGRFIPGFEDQLIGAKTKEQVSVKVTFPEDYGAENLKGKEASFEVDIKEIRERIETPIDDELAKSLGLDSLEALKNGTRQQLEQNYSMFTRNRLKRDLLDKLDSSHEFELPPGMIETEVGSILEQFEQARQEDRIEENDKEKSEEELRAEYEKIAQRRVRLGLLLANIGRLNNIEVSAEEVNQAMLQEVRRYPGQERQVMEYFQQNEQAMAGLRAPIFEDKVVDFIIEMATVSDRNVSPEELMTDPENNPSEEKKSAPKKKSSPKKKKAAATKKKKPKGKTEDTDVATSEDC